MPLVWPPHRPPILSFDGLHLKDRDLSNVGRTKNLGSKKGKGRTQILDAEAFRKEGIEREEHRAEGEEGQGRAQSRRGGGAQGHDGRQGHWPVRVSRTEKDQDLFLALCAFSPAHGAVEEI